MATWTCANCRRTFGAVGRGHTCVPGLTVAEFLACTPEFTGPVFHRVRDHLTALDVAEGGDLIVDPLEKKVLFKNGPTFCIVDVKTKWVAVGFTLRRKLESTRLSRKVTAYGDKFHHVVNVDDPCVIDDEFLGWLTDAYHHGSAPKPNAHDPMVPDDIDFELG